MNIPKLGTLLPYINCILYRHVETKAIRKHMKKEMLLQLLELFCRMRQKDQNVLKELVKPLFLNSHQISVPTNGLGRTCISSK